MQNQSKHVTAFGRAISPGRVTRASIGVRKTPRGVKDSPLPFDLAVHPKALSPTPHHPQCWAKTRPQGGAGVMIANEMCRAHFLQGKGLDGGTYLIQCGEKELGRTDDVVYAMAWKQAARTHGVWVEVYHEAL